VRRRLFRDVLNSSRLRRLRTANQDREPAVDRSENFTPTDALPGTQEKMRVFVERIESGLPLWHPADRAATSPHTAVDREEDKRPVPKLPNPSDELFDIYLDTDDLVN